MTYVALANVAAVMLALAALARLARAHAARTDTGRAALILLGAVVVMGGAGISRRLSWEHQDSVVAIAWTAVAGAAAAVVLARRDDTD